MRLRPTARFPLVAILTLSVAVGSKPATAEIYKGIAPYSNLATIKAMFPGATFEKVTPAWALPKDAMYEMSGEGLSGKIVLKFTDGRPQYIAIRDSLHDPAGEDSLMFAYWDALANGTEDDALHIDWVRWVPDAPIPLARFVARYGSAFRRGYADEDMQPYRLWATRGICAFLADGERTVVRVDYTYTTAEWQRAYNQLGVVQASRNAAAHHRGAHRASK